VAASAMGRRRREASVAGRTDRRPS
jgi:hypothetical protein